MAYIGNTVQNQGFAPAIDYFNGNGVTVTFTLSRPVASVAQLIVAIDNVIQNPSSSFTVAGNAITFTSAPLAGTNNIWVEYTSLITTYQGISQDPTVIGDIRATGGYLAEGDFGNSFVDGNLIDYVTGRGRLTVGELDDITFYHGGTSARSPMMDLYYAGGAKIYGTTALTIPAGTTGERPGTPADGMIRMNTTTRSPEWYFAAGSSWVPFNSAPVVAAPLVLVAGGGSGGQISNGGQSNRGSGGGAGGYIYIPNYNFYIGTTYTVTIGAGGAGNSGTTTNKGVDSTITALVSGLTRTITALGGGSGGYSDSTNNATSGGSGGGQWFPGYTGAPATQPSTTSDGVVSYAGTGFGNKGGDSGGGQPYGSGGGGAGGAGGNFNSGSGGFGGVGQVNPITGSTAGQNVSGTYYLAGGGSSDGFSGTPGGVGGYGGGGTGYNTAYNPASNGTANTGGGGGSGGSGGSGICIISIPTSIYSGVYTGSPTITTSGSNTILTFNASGTYTA
jgi:hypothetical protein